MNAAERKQFLQSIGALPQDEVPGMADTEAPAQPEEPKPQAQDPYSQQFGAEPQSPRDKLNRLMTPEFMQGLRKKAGMDGEGG